MMTAVQWLLIDNLKNGWYYQTNLSLSEADAAYLWAVENGYIKDGRITDAGEVALLTNRRPKA